MSHRQNETIKKKKNGKTPSLTSAPTACCAAALLLASRLASLFARFRFVFASSSSLATGAQTRRLIHRTIMEQMRRRLSPKTTSNQSLQNQRHPNYKEFAPSKGFEDGKRDGYSISHCLCTSYTIYCSIKFIIILVNQAHQCKF